MNTSILSTCIGQEVQLFPNDTYAKYGIIKAVDDTGVLILISKAHPKSRLSVGEIVFYSHSAKLIFTM